MKIALQLLVAGLVIHASVRVADSAWRYFSFKDAIQQEVLFSADLPTTQLHARVVEIASQHGIDLAPVDVEVNRVRDQTTVVFSYSERIPLVPAAYTRDHLYEGAVSARSLRGLK